ncbi:MAG: methyltransferase domain-containing protein [Candidatus Chlorobium antarcticum]|nr:methyltransferase domain-containing protein [Candidatus Chlorobium antarcticum]
MPFSTRPDLNDFHSLREALAREYDLAESPYSFGGREFFFTSVSDSYALLDRITPEEFLRDEQMPYWAEIWPSSLALCSFLCEELQLKGVSAVELGAGVGVVSIVAASRGGKVLATDYSPEALRFIRCNALANAMGIRVERLDWRNVMQPRKFEMVLAADVLYERVNLLPIITAIDQLLESGGSAYIADPRRRMAEQFLELAAENGFSVTAYAREYLGVGKLVSVNIYRLRRGEHG